MHFSMGRVAQFTWFSFHVLPKFNIKTLTPWTILTQRVPFWGIFVHFSNRAAGKLRILVHGFLCRSVFQMSTSQCESHPLTYCTDLWDLVSRIIWVILGFTGNYQLLMEKDSLGSAWQHANGMLQKVFHLNPYQNFPGFLPEPGFFASLECGLKDSFQRCSHNQHASDLTCRIMFLGSCWPSRYARRCCSL